MFKAATLFIFGSLILPLHAQTFTIPLKCSTVSQTTTCSGVVTSEQPPIIPPEPPVSEDHPFTALHLYHLSPTGDDAHDGLTIAAAWKTPAHPVVCGDVIVAEPGAYSSTSFDGYSQGKVVWGKVASCPSTTGGIDGKGGIYVAAIVCAGDVGACRIAGSTQYAMEVGDSHWAVEGFKLSNNVDGNGACATARGNPPHPTSHIAFINDIAADCPLAGFNTDGFPSSHQNATDQFAVVGSVAFNAARSASYCGSGLTDNIPVDVNNDPGTHVFFSQDFSYGNINGPCSANSIYKGAYTTVTTPAAAGSTSITVAAVNGWGANWPIGAGLGVNYASASPAIPQPTLVKAVSGTRITLDVAAPGLTNGQMIAVGTSTDGNGLIMDRWDVNQYSGKTVVENNWFWQNGAHGFEMFCLYPTQCAARLNVLFTQNTMYCNGADYKRDGNVWEFYDAESGPGPWTFTVTNNIGQTCRMKPEGSATFAGVGMAGTGQPITAAAFGRTGIAATGNYFSALPGTPCVIYANCAGPNNDLANFNGANYAAGNTLGVDPKFAAPDTLPMIAPDCAGFASAVECMNAKYHVATILTSSVAPTKGAQAPGPCKSDDNYPIWLKGVAFLHWDGNRLIEKAGAVTKPCDM